MRRLLPALLFFTFAGLRTMAQSALPNVCTSACQGVLGENIYPNGDFGAGQPNVILTNPGLAPGYQYQPSPPPNDGYYTIANNTTPWGWFAGNLWINIEDNGPEPNGYMMVVNASYAPGIFFQNTVAVCENTMYEFSIDVINVFESAYTQSIKPNLTFLVDGIAYCETGDIPIDEEWHTARFSFTTLPGQTSVVLGMRNNAPGGYGNDLAIDNISFRACGPELVSQDTTWFCPGSPVALDVQLHNSPFDTTVYQWQIWENNAWQDLPGADSVTLILNNPENGRQFRLLAASALSNLQDLNCRAVSQIFHLFERPPIQLQLTGADADCFGLNNAGATAQALQGTAPFSYLWNTGSSAAVLSGLSPGLYTVTATDAQGCTGVAAITLNEPPLLSAQTTALPVRCFNESSGQVIAAATGGTAPYSFSWNNSAEGHTLQSVPAGAYEVTITDVRGCTVSSAAEVTSPAALGSSTSTGNVTCFGAQDGFIAVAVDGGTAPYVFNWNNGQNNPQISALSAGTFSLTITDALGCQLETEATILQPDLLSVNTTFTSVSCQGGYDASAAALPNGGIAPYTFNWHTGDTTAQIGGLPAGYFSVTVLDAHGCSSISEGSVMEPPGLSIDILTEHLNCFNNNNGAATAVPGGGTPPYQFIWNTGQTTPEINGLAAGVYTATVTDANGCVQMAGSTIQQPAALSTNIAVQAVTCSGETNGAAAVLVNGGTTPYQWLWSTGQNTAQINGLQAGDYTVSITDANGCNTSAMATVLEPTVLTSGVSATQVSCFGGHDAVATATGYGGTAPYQWLWNNGQNTAQISGISAGTVTVTVTDANGCTTLASQTIQEPTALVNSLNASDISCFGASSGSAMVVGSGGVPPYQFLWSNGFSGENLNNLAAGNYTVTTTDVQGCTTTGSVVVHQPPALLVDTETIAVACAGGNNGAATAMPQGGTSPYQITWSNGQTGQSALGLTAGLYTVIIRDALGCTTAAEVRVTAPPALQATPAAQPVSCYGGADGMAIIIPEGGVPPYVTTWNTGQTGLTISQLPAGSYTATLTDSHGCSFSAAAIVTQPAQALSGQTAAQAVDCYGANSGAAWASAAGGTPPYQFLWGSGQSSSNISGLPAAWYPLTISDAQGCTHTTEVWVSQPPPLQLQTTAWPSACAEVTTGKITAAATGGSGAYQFVWSNGREEATLYELAAGEYTVTVMDANGCTAVAGQVVNTLTLPEIDLGLDQAVQLGEEVQLTAQTNLPAWRVAEYRWLGDAVEQTCPGCFEFQFQPLADGCQTLEIVSIEGCVARDEVCYEVIPDRNIYVPNIFHPDGDGQNDFFTIYSDESVSHIRYLRVYDRWGNQVFDAQDIQTNHEPSGWDGFFRGQAMNPGVFAWVAVVVFIDGEAILLKGDVTLYR